MKTLFSFDYQGHTYELRGNNWGKEVLLRDGAVVSALRRFRYSGTHHFQCPKLGALRVTFKIDGDGMVVRYRLCNAQQTLHEGEQCMKHLVPNFLQKIIEQQEASSEVTSAEAVPAEAIAAPEKPAPTGLKKGFLAFKNNPVALKVTLAIAALVGWSLWFDFEIAIALILVILIHEYGHIWAMKRTGMTVKGVYLVPFLGGVAVGEGTKTRWQDFKIFIAGPFVGTLGAVVFWVLWLQTGYEFLALLTGLSLLINLFNLIPIVPLDGGQVVKSALLSLNLTSARPAMLVINVAFVVLMFWLDFNIIGFFGILGLLDIAFSGKDEKQPHAPMNATGIIVTLLSYGALLATLVLIAGYMDDTGVPGADLLHVFLE